MAQRRAARHIREEERRQADANAVYNPAPVPVPLARLSESKQSHPSPISSHP
jgi:hypothetical protein